MNKILKVYLEREFNRNITLEYKFSENKKFRFDLAIISEKIAIEIEGGIWKQGRHGRGQGYSNDCIKYNLAVVEGWKLLRYTPQQLKNDISIIKKDVRALLNELERNKKELYCNGKRKKL